MVFIFDEDILSKLENKADARVTFIHQQFEKINAFLISQGSSLLVKYGTVVKAWQQILNDFNITEVFTNRDYEPYARKRDEFVATLLEKHNVVFNTYKDQVIFEKNEVQKADGTPYTVFTPFYKLWLKKINPFYVKPYPCLLITIKLYQITPFKFPSLGDIGFTASAINFPDKDFDSKLGDYETFRDFPAHDATAALGCI